MADNTKKNPWASVDASGYDWNSGEEFDPEPKSNNTRTETPARTQQSVQPDIQTATPVQPDAQAAQTPAVRSVPQSGTSADLSRQAAQTVNNNRRSYADTGTFRGYLDDWLSGAKQQSEGRIDRAVTQGVNELARVQEDAGEQYQTQRNQIDADEKRALDNQALYMAMNGMSRSGVGMEQYNSIMNTAMRNRVTVNNAQTKLANDTRRQIAELRANGEFQKSQELVQLNQEYLSRLSALEQWAMEYNASVDQFNASLDQWLASYNAQLRQMDLSQYQWERSFAYQKERDRVADNQWERTFSANRSDAAWQRGITERQLSNDEARNAWQQGITERQLANDEANTRWQQGITERQLSNDEARNAWQQGITERQLANDEARNAWQQGITERQLANDEARNAWQQDMTERQYADSRSDTRWQQGVTEQQLASSQLSNLQQYVMSALSSGYMVDDATLAQAKIDKNYASLIVSNARNAAELESQKAAAELENKQADTANKQASALKSAASLSGTGTGSTTKPPLTADQVQTEIRKKNFAPNVLSAYEYYYGESYFRKNPSAYPVENIKSRKDAVSALESMGLGAAASGLMNSSQWNQRKLAWTRDKTINDPAVSGYSSFMEYVRDYVRAMRGDNLRGDDAA